MWTIVSHFFFFLTIIFGNGILLRNILIKNENVIINYYEIVFLGFFFSGFLSILINFIYPLKDEFIYINFIISIFIIYKNKFIFNQKKNYAYPAIIFFILVLFNIYSSGFSDDLTHYHASYIQNIDYEKIIIGFNNLHHHFGYNSIWLNLHSYLNFNNSFLQDIHVLNGLLFFLILTYFFNEILFFKKTESKLVLISFFFLTFFLLKYTRLKEFGLDRPGVIIFSFILYFFIKYNVVFKEYNQKKFLISYIMIGCFFLFSIKVFFIFSFILVFLLIYQNWKKYNLACVNFYIIFFLSLIYITKNLLVSGCAIYPINFTCIESIPWNSKIIANDLFLRTEASTKNFDLYKGSLSIKEYIHSFNWFSTWFIKNYEEFFNFFITGIISTFSCYICSMMTIKKKLNETNIILIAIFISNLILFIKIPVVRYHHILFLSFFLCLIYFFQFNKKKIYTVFFILLLCVIFNIGKNFIRIKKENFVNNPINYLKKIKWYSNSERKTLGNFIYYIGWIGGHPIGDMNLSDKNYKKLFGYNIIYN